MYTRLRSIRLIRVQPGKGKTAACGYFFHRRDDAEVTKIFPFDFLGGLCGNFSQQWPESLHTMIRTQMTQMQRIITDLVKTRISIDLKKICYDLSYPYYLCSI